MDLELRIALVKLAAPAVVIALIAAIVLYLIVKWRAARESIVDPQLGFKLVLYYFATLAFQMALLGATLLVYSMIKPSSDEVDKSYFYRIAFGLIVPAGLVLGAHLALLPRTNDASQSGVRRLFIALNLILTGIAGFTALVVGFQALFAKGSSLGIGHLGAGATLIYCTAWGLLAWRYHQLVIGGGVFGSGDGETLPDVVLPPAPPPTTQAASGPGLPPLGGGSFPPIDRK